MRFSIKGLQTFPIFTLNIRMSDTHTVSILIQCSFQCSLKEATEVRMSNHARQLLSSFVLLALFNHNMKLDVSERVIILDGKKSTIIVLNILYVYI